MTSLFKKTLLALSAGAAVLSIVGPGVAGAAPQAAGRPSIVLVHGAWANGSSWDKVAAILIGKGYTVVAVHDPMASLSGDVATVKRAIDAQPGPVILVGHSYGGAVITQAGNDDKVAALVYVAAYAPSEGETVDAINKTFPPQSWWSQIKADPAGYLTLSADAVVSHFAQDLPGAEARVLAATQGPTNAACFGEAVTQAAWKTKPSWYVVSGNDKILPPSYEAAMAKKLGAQTTTLPSSHVAMIAHPREVADVIVAAAQKVVAP